MGKKPQTKAKKSNKVVELYPKKKKYVTYLNVFLAVFIISICIFEIFKINYSPVKTEIAFEKNISDVISCEGFIVRDETPITAKTSGTLVPLVVDGRRVAREDAVAVSFATDAAAKNYTQTENIQKQIAYYESLVNMVGTHTTDMAALDERVYETTAQYICAVSAGQVDAQTEAAEALCRAMTSRQLASGVQIDPTAKLDALKAELAQLQQAAGGYTTVYAPKPGYYIGYVDGYENALPYEQATTASAEQIQKLFSAQPTPKEQRQAYMGKLVDSFNWYLYCVVDAESVGDLSVGQRITVEFPTTNAEAVEAEIMALQNTGDGKTAVTLRSNIMNAQYAGLRRQTVRLVLRTHTGYPINNRAIREVDGQKGVYVLSGNIIKFRKIHILSSDSNYSLCSTPLDKNGHPEKGYVELYDEIIVKGTDLYDGKVLG